MNKTIEQVRIGQTFIYQKIVYIKTTNTLMTCRGVALTDDKETSTGYVYALPANAECQTITGYSDVKDTIDELYIQNGGSNKDTDPLMKLLILHPEFQHPMEKEEQKA